MKFSQEAIDKLKACYRYDSDTGGIFNVKTGRELTGLNSEGYRMVQFRLNGKQCKYLAHHVAWFFEYGVWPTKDIDHINRVRSDNRIVNLREVSRAENLRNKGALSNDKQTQYECVSWHKFHNKWQARMPYRLDRKRTRIGYFNTDKEAHEALQRAIANTTHYRRTLRFNFKTLKC